MLCTLAVMQLYGSILLIMPLKLTNLCIYYDLADISKFNRYFRSANAIFKVVKALLWYGIIPIYSYVLMFYTII